MGAVRVGHGGGLEATDRSEVADDHDITEEPAGEPRGGRRRQQPDADRCVGPDGDRPHVAGGGDAVHSRPAGRSGREGLPNHAATPLNEVPTTASRSDSAWTPIPDPPPMRARTPSSSPGR